MGEKAILQGHSTFWVAASTTQRRNAHRGSQSPIGSVPDMDQVRTWKGRTCKGRTSQSPIGSGPDMDRGQRTILQMSGF